MMDNNDDLTIAARVKGWEIFTPDWGYLRQHPALQLGSLCALSVGLHPYFDDPSWVLNIAKSHFNGTDPDEFCPLEDATAGAKRAAMLDDFLRRVHIATANLSPLGALAPAIGNADSVQTLVRVADFVTWADGMGWNLPAEFPRPQLQRPKETPDARRTRLAKKRDILKASGVKGFLKQLATEEGVSVSRIKQYLSEKKPQTTAPGWMTGATSKTR